jgi:TrmH family RNA methyltransferase
VRGAGAIPEKLITSKDNPRVRRWARLARDGRFRRAEGRAIVEGPHLVGLVQPVAVFGTRDAPILLSESAFRSIAEAQTPQGVAAEIEIPRPKGAIAAPAVFLEGVQDPGNVGAILRSAAAFGVKAAVLDRACADPWSPKVLRAAMGGHFALSIHEVEKLDLGHFKGKVLCTAARGGVPLDEADLSGPIAWLFGTEGQGVSLALQAQAAQKVTIPMARGTESINVAAAAAICFYRGATNGPGARR